MAVEVAGVRASVQRKWTAGKWTAGKSSKPLQGSPDNCKPVIFATGERYRVPMDWRAVDSIIEVESSKTSDTSFRRSLSMQELCSVFKMTEGAFY